MFRNLLTPSQRVALAVIAAIPLALVVANAGPGRWMNETQDAVFGTHSLRLSYLGVYLAQCLLLAVVAVAVRLLTGRTLVELVNGDRNPASLPHGLYYQTTYGGRELTLHHRDLRPFQGFRSRSPFRPSCSPKEAGWMHPQRFRHRL